MDCYIGRVRISIYRNRCRTTGQSSTLTKINGLALYNNGDKPIVFNPGNIAALTATFTK